MKKTTRIALIMGIIAGLSGIATANLVDGGFEGSGALDLVPAGSPQNGLYHQAAGVSTLDQGWYSGIDRMTQQGTTDKYAQFASNAGWDKFDRWWIGQMWTDSVITGNQQISFDIENSAYLSGSDQTMVFEVFTVPGTADFAKLRLDSDVSSFALIGSQAVNISGGIGSYTTGNIDFTATSDLYAIRIQVYDSISGTASGNLGLDNVSVIPEPATFGLLAAFSGALFFIRRCFLI